ncbi:DNA polymerase/3'-5' exonuclease PolX [Candidatus Uhrbacteria bacterium]|nr:DNA polymerase/3'-5' exonuclease PolX [Candidatus Uhrbacteria bacterium]
MTNNEIAKTLQEISEYLEIQDDSFRARAYNRASGVIASLERHASDIYKEGGIKALEKIPSVGKGIAEKIEELLTKNSIAYLEQLKKELPANISELSAVEGVGPSTIKTLYKKLGVKTLADLEKVARTGKIRALPHFGQKSEQKILKSIEFLKKNKGRFLLGEILPIARSIEKRIGDIPGVSRVNIAGSLRRMQETIGDIDIVVSASDPSAVMKAFISFPEVTHIYGTGHTKTNVRLAIGIDADVRVVKEKEYGATLLYFTGDTQHNIELRKLAIKKRWKLSEYGLYKGTKFLAGHTEEEVYKKLGLAWIPPEIRTASGEIKSAQTRTLPDLIPYGSIRGDLQVQTSWSDGIESIEKMAIAAMANGLSYIAITDHTKSLGVAGGLSERELARQGKEIDMLNKKFNEKKFHIFKSAEINIFKNGRFDISDSALKKLDVVSASVHSHFGMTENEMTERIIKAMKHPLLNIFFHPTGRLLKKREPYQVDILKIIKAAKEYGVALEVNAQPQRLDLKDTHIRLAVEHGVKLIVNTDAHAPDHFRYLDFGIGQVRRGWGKRADLLNTKPADQLLKSLRKLKMVKLESAKK